MQCKRIKEKEIKYIDLSLVFEEFFSTLVFCCRRRRRRLLEIHLFNLNSDYTFKLLLFELTCLLCLFFKLNEVS